MRIHNFRLIFNEYDAIISPTYVGHIIIKVCLVGFGRTNDQFSRNTVTSGFSLAMRIHDFGLSEENDAIILCTYVGHIIIKVCVVGLETRIETCNENPLFWTTFDEYDVILPRSYVSYAIIKVLAMRIHNFRVIFNEYDAILSPTYVGHIIIKVCVVGFGRTNDQFSRNTVTSGFSLAMRIHDFGLSEENDAIILRTYVGHTIVKVCVVGFGRKNDQFSRNNPLFRPNSDNYYDAYNENPLFQNNSDEYGASLTHSYITQVITTVCLVRCGRNNNQFLRNTVTPVFRLAMKIYDSGPILKITMPFFHALAMRIHNFGLSEENDAIILCTYVGHIIIKVYVVGFGRKNDQLSRNTVSPGFKLAMRIKYFRPILTI
ncbi:hypothetical protein OROHE_016398 [Orobanche hederae]